MSHRVVGCLEGNRAKASGPGHLSGYPAAGVGAELFVAGRKSPSAGDFLGSRGEQRYGYTDSLEVGQK